MDGTHEGSRTLQVLERCGLVSAVEAAAVQALLAPGGRFADAVALADTVHLHVKVDDTHALPLNDFFDAGARLDHQKDGFVKYRFPGGLNLICSHIPVSQDEQRETAANRRPRPFVDHVGIDLRRESAEVRAAFDALPGQAAALGWAHAAQGGPGQPVQCCHVEVGEKHWLYPGAEAGQGGIPLEFSFGALTLTPGRSGCDLRPSDPRSAAAPEPACCPAPAAAPSGAAGDGYFQPRDLQRFADISRVNPALGNAFFDYYRQVLGDGVLGKAEKALVALAVAHAIKCPYSIHAYTEALFELGVDEARMSEAVHVASALVAGSTLVHSVQMMARLDQLRAGAATPPTGCC
jgi:alkylhydroperoxidase/carboxymuconolactone decarboxylase family protein